MEYVVKSHAYLRAYMAGVLLPTWVLLIVLAGVLIGHLTEHLPAGAERAVIFPMAVVPNVWGLWNVLYVALHLRQRVPIGAFGAILPLLLVPAGLALTLALRLEFYTAVQAAILLPLVTGIYFLAWKYGVGFFNRIVGLG
jgi:hypothetical protein